MPAFPHGQRSHDARCVLPPAGRRPGNFHRHLHPQRARGHRRRARRDRRGAARLCARDHRRRRLHRHAHRRPGAGLRAGASRGAPGQALERARAGHRRHPRLGGRARTPAGADGRRRPARPGVAGAHAPGPARGRVRRGRRQPLPAVGRIRAGARPPPGQPRRGAGHALAARHPHRRPDERLLPDDPGLVRTSASAPEDARLQDPDRRAGRRRAGAAPGPGPRLPARTPRRALQARPEGGARPGRAAGGEGQPRPGVRAHGDVLRGGHERAGRARGHARAGDPGAGMAAVAGPDAGDLAGDDLQLPAQQPAHLPRPQAARPGRPAGHGDVLCRLPERGDHQRGRGAGAGRRRGRSPGRRGRRRPSGPWSWPPSPSPSSAWGAATSGRTSCSPSTSSTTTAAWARSCAAR